MSVPGQISVVGFGDEPFARHSVPALTTVRVLAEQIGATAADAILDLAAGRDPSFQATAVKLVLRESSGPAP
jgi:DNA-binding LacI/PurR family transcriptional regulator